MPEMNAMKFLPVFKIAKYWNNQNRIFEELLNVTGSLQIMDLIETGFGVRFKAVMYRFGFY